jgi:putative redox protein
MGFACERHQSRCSISIVFHCRLQAIDTSIQWGGTQTMGGELDGGPYVMLTNYPRYSEMGRTTSNAIIKFSGDDLFIAITPSGHAQVLDTNSERASAASPVELLLIALGSCTGIDVVSILKKKRQDVTDYRIEVSGERRTEHPRAYTRMQVRHILRGRNLSEKAVAQAVELSEAKYCSVAATLRPTVEIVSSFEIIEETD